MRRFFSAAWMYLGVCVFATQLQAHAVYYGGSNYNWFHVSIPPFQDDHECSFPPYGIINNYDLSWNGQTVRSIVQAQLAQMRASGQETIKFYLYFSDYALNLGCTPPDFPNSRSTVIETHSWDNQIRQNLNLFLTDIQSAGFQRLMIGFLGVQSNNPRTWIGNWGTQIACSPEQAALWGRCPTPSELYAQNWAFIQQVRTAAYAYAPGVTKYFDLYAEGGDAFIDQGWGDPSPGPGVSVREYVRRVWYDYNLWYGKADTVGVSATGLHCMNPSCSSQSTAAGDLADHLETLLYIYDISGWGRPLMHSIHTYYGTGQAEFETADARLDFYGASTEPFIIGETYYNERKRYFDL
jgi:hypothetical protein